MRWSLHLAVSIGAGLALGLLGVSTVSAQRSADEVRKKAIDIVPEAKPGSNEPGRVLALVVGINEYRSQNIEKLKFAAGDARAIRDRVIPRIPAYQAHVNFLADDQATRRRILRGLDELAAARENDTVLIYFSLHGVTDKSRSNGFLVPYDADPEDVETTGVAVQMLLQKVNAIKANRVFVLLDACFSGTATSGWAGGSRTFSYGATAKAGVNLPTDIYEAVKSQQGHFVLSASQPSQPALELRNLGHGLFTYFVLEGLEGAAADANTGAVDVFDLYKYVSRHVEAVSVALKEKQTPMMKGDGIAGQPPIITVPKTSFKPNADRLVTLINEARQSFQSSRLMINGNGGDRLEIYVNNDLKWSGSERAKEFLVKKEDFERYGSRQVQVKVVAVPSAGDRKREERTFNLDQGEQKELVIESSVIPRPATPPRSRVIPPMF